MYIEPKSYEAIFCKFDSGQESTTHVGWRRAEHWFGFGFWFFFTKAQTKSTFCGLRKKKVFCRVLRF